MGLKNPAVPALAANFLNVKTKDAVFKGTSRLGHRPTSPQPGRGPRGGASERDPACQGVGPRVTACPAPATASPLLDSPTGCAGAGQWGRLISWPHVPGGDPVLCPQDGPILRDVDF